MPQIGNLPLYKVQLAGKWQGERVRNIFHYVQDDAFGPVDAEDVADAFDTQVLTPLLVATTDDLTYGSIIVEQVNDTTNFFTKPKAVTGASSQEPLPTFNTVSIRLNRDDRLLRNGRKSFAGAHVEQVDGSTLNATGISNWTTATAALVDSLSGIGGAPFPVILRMTRDPDTKELQPVSQWLYVTFSSVTVRPVVGTQVTRKIGAGE